MAGLDFSSVKSVEIPEGVCKKIVDKTTGNTLWEEASSVLDYFYIQSESSSPITIQMKKISSAPDVNLEYSLDGTNWSEFKSGNQTTVTLNSSGSKAYFRGDNDKMGKSGGGGGNNFVVSGSFSVGGNIMSLLDSTLEQQELTDTNQYAFSFLFNSCSTLKYADKLLLPSSYIPNRAYISMFESCSALETPPTIMATRSGTEGMSCMFRWCSELRYCRINLKPLNPITGAYGIMDRIFMRCYKLAELHVKFDEFDFSQSSSEYYPTYNWLRDAGTQATSPKFYCPTALEITERNDNTVPNRFEIIREDV